MYWLLLGGLLLGFFKFIFDGLYSLNVLGVHIGQFIPFATTIHNLGILYPISFVMVFLAFTKDWRILVAVFLISSLAVIGSGGVLI